MTDKGTFDPKTALRAEIEGIGNVLLTLTSQTSHAEMKAAEAAAQHDALLKLTAFTKDILAQKRTALQKLQEADAR